MSNYNDNSWSDKFSWIITVIAMVLVAILSIGLLCALFIQPEGGRARSGAKRRRRHQRNSGTRRIVDVGKDRPCGVCGKRSLCVGGYCLYPHGER